MVNQIKYFVYLNIQDQNQKEICFVQGGMRMRSDERAVRNKFFLEDDFSLEVKKEIPRREFLDFTLLNSSVGLMSSAIAEQLLLVGGVSAPAAK